MCDGCIDNRMTWPITTYPWRTRPMNSPAGGLVTCGLFLASTSTHRPASLSSRFIVSAEESGGPTWSEKHDAQRSLAADIGWVRMMGQRHGRQGGCGDLLVVVGAEA
ncbi:hypothetical protein SEVIR_4G194552v4 [Setaria viridis]